MWSRDPDLHRFLADESLWSRDLFKICPIAYADLLAYLGRQLRLAHGDILHDPLPERLVELLESSSDKHAGTPPARSLQNERRL